MEHRDFFKVCASAVVCAASMMGTAWAQDKQVWKASDVHPIGYPTVEAIQRMGKKLEKETNGRISIQMYPSMQLGGEKEMIEQAQVGACRLRASRSARWARWSMSSTSSICRSFSRRSAHAQGDRRSDRSGAAREDHGEPAVAAGGAGWMDAGTRNVYSNKPVTKPEDLKGQKIRMMGNPLFVETMNAMGGNGVAMGFNELYGALQTGVVDGAENNPPTLLAQNHYTVSKVYSLTGT